MLSLRISIRTRKLRNLPLLYSHEQLYIHIYMQKHIQHNKDERRQSSLEKYTSHFIERVVCERELETEQKLQHIDPHSSGYHSLSFPFSWAAQPGAWGPSLSGTWFSFQHLSPTDLNFLSPGLYNYFLQASQFRTQFNPSTVKVAPDLLISSTGCTCYLHRCISSFDSLAGSEVNMQHRLNLAFKITH